MRESKPKVIVIPAAPKNTGPAEQRQLRVAAYCRVSTKEEDQLNSYEAQKNYYTDKIMENKSWTMADIFADEGITGTSAKKRADFMRMMKWCKQGKIDLILTKSVSRFARNTVDCLNYVRMLKAQGIAVYFEKENINSMDESTELMLVIHPNRSGELTIADVDRQLEELAQEFDAVLEMCYPITLFQKRSTL